MTLGLDNEKFGAFVMSEGSADGPALVFRH
jgi:hypothetical protein